MQHEQVDISSRSLVLVCDVDLQRLAIGQHNAAEWTGGYTFRGRAGRWTRTAWLLASYSVPNVKAQTQNEHYIVILNT